MSKPSIFVKETASTNVLMKELLRTTELPEGYVVRTDFQTNGKGQGSNVWESEKGKNLLFSLLLRPTHVLVGEQFLIAQIVSLAILKVLSQTIQHQKLRISSDNHSSDVFTIKWPNDIYWGDKKMGGMLIENVWQGSHITSSIVGVGLNVNQEAFYSDAPNPVSLRQIRGVSTSKMRLLQAILDEVFRYYKLSQHDDIRKEYAQLLYRSNGYYPFKDEKGLFDARIADIEKDGRLVLMDTAGELAGYYFKEVEFVISKSNTI